jgi:hypothetical protein
LKDFGASKLEKSLINRSTMVSSTKAKRIKTEHKPEQDEDETMLKPTQSATQSASAGLGDFAVGAIVRIRLKNFVTYDSVDFIPVLSTHSSNSRVLP